MRQIFVFGSNHKGIHGAGAAKYAYMYCGARRGMGDGMTGDSYALATKWTPRKRMELEEVAVSVTNFMNYAHTRPDLRFMITQIGCGLGGFTKEHIAPLFAEHIISPNLYFDSAWKPFLPSVAKFWGTM